MNKLTIYKSVIATILSASIVLLSGCSDKDAKGRTDTCTHTVIFFENGPITFKECEGYKVSFFAASKAEIPYKVYKNEKLIVSGSTSNHNCYEVDHSSSNELFETENIQKVK